MFELSWAARIAMAAHKALIYEVLTAPKPGLVDRFNSGAHGDMDVFTFVDSAQALLPYFYECAERAEVWQGEPEALLPVLRPLGLEAEKTMLRATGGINTHKGAVFSMGLFCAAAALCGDGAKAEELCLMAGRIASPVRKDFEKEDFGGNTAGERIYAATGSTGVRGEAIMGFPSLRDTAIPTMRDALSRGLSLNDAAVETLARLILRAEDTAFIKRCGGREAEPYLASVREALESENLTESLRETDILWSRAGLSAGGCADLLAVCLFLYFHISEKGGRF